MLTPRLTRRLPAFILGCLTAALLTSQVMAQGGAFINYTNGQTYAAGYDTTGSIVTLTLTLGTATQSGLLTGSGSVLKADTGTLILSASNDYSGTTTLTAGTLQVVASGAISHSSSDLYVGKQSGDVATLLISGGSVSNANGYLGYDSGSNGTAMVSSGTWTNNSDLTIGNDGTGVLNISGGSVSNDNGILGASKGSSGTVNVSSGTWTNNSDLTIGNDGTGVLNLTDQGKVSVNSGNGTLYLANSSDSTGTLNLGTGGTAGILKAASVSGGDGTAVVNFNHTGVNVFTPTLGGALTVNQIGPGTTTLTAGNTYTGSTHVLGGTLLLGFFPYSPSASNILPSTTDLTLGSGTLHVSSYISIILVGGGIIQTGNSLAPAFQSDSIIVIGPGGGGIYPSTPTQTVNSFSTAFQGGGSIVLDMNRTLVLGTLNSIGKLSAVNFNTAATGANGANTGSGVIVLTGPSAGDAISSGFTVTDATGFGLATVDGSDQVIRLTTTALLPASGADAGTDYLINNNAGSSSTAGSSSLLISTSQSARSITVDTTAASGVLSLASGVVLGSDVWNFGSNGNGGFLFLGSGGGSHTFEITGSDSGAGITTTTAGGTLQFNNYNASPVTLSTNILDHGTTSVLFHGPGTTILTGTNMYNGDTTVSSGVLQVAGSGSITSLGTTTVGSQTGDNAVLNILGLVQDFSAVVGDAAGSTGTVNVNGNGEWDQKDTLTVGNSGTGVLNIDGGLVSSRVGILGANADSSGTVTVSNFGEWDVYGGLFIGQDGTGVLNLTDGGAVYLNGFKKIAGGTVTLGAQGTLNFGTGGATGYLLGTTTVTGDSGAVVNYDYNDFGRFKSPSNPVLTGDLAVNKLGGGYLFFDQQNTYTGGTTVNGGTLELDFFSVKSDIISRSSALTLGGGTLSLYAGKGPNSQTLNGLTTTAGTGSQIYLSSSVTLNLGALTSAGSGSALNFDTYDGGADGARVGTGIVLLSGQTTGSVINPGYTVTDSTGFGLATVNDFNQIIRLSNTSLLPDSGAVAGTDYLIDNNDGDNTDPGSSILEITASQTARSITVDATQSAGRLTLDAAVVLSSDVWNFGSSNGYPYEITGSGPGTGITTATAGGMLQINNYNYGTKTTVTISAPIMDNGGSGLRVAGTGLTILTGADTYTGETIINGGTLFINGDHTAATGEITVQSSAELAGTGMLGSHIHVQNGGILTPGSIAAIGTLTGTTATFDTNSIFHVIGGGTTLSSLHLTGTVTLAAGALFYIDTDSPLTLTKYTLMTAASGLDGSTAFNVESSFGKPLKGGDVLPGYHLVYTGKTLELDADVTAPAVAYWTGKVDNKWSSLTSGNSNWATAADGLTDTAALPDSPTDVTFTAQTVPLNTTVLTVLDLDLTINSLTVNTPTIITANGVILTGPGAPPLTTHTLTVTTTTTINSQLGISDGATLIDNGTLTIAKEGNLYGNGAVQMAADQSMIVNGSITGPISDFIVPGAQALSLTTSGTGAIMMEAGSTLHLNLNTGAGLGDNTGISSAAGVLNLHGILNATAGGTLVLENHNAMTGFAGGDQWKVIDLNSGAGAITGHLALNDSSLGLATGFIGTFDQTTGIYSIADHRPEMTTQSSGLPMANAEGQSINSGVQTATNDVNNHLFNLRSGGGEEDSDGSIASSLDEGVVLGQGDGPEDPIAKRVKRTRQWEVFTTVNYGNVRLNPISNQSGVQIDSWASSVGVERHLSRGFMLGFAATFLQSTQSYTGGLGNLHLEGPSLSAYVSYVRRNYWSSLLYSFGDYDLGSQRNPGLGLPTASGATNAYTNAVQYNTGWNFRFQNNTLITGPFAGIDYLHGTVDAYTETGGGAGALHYGKQTFESLVTRIGWSASKKIETTWASIIPQLRLSYERQNLKNNGTSVNLINAPFSAAGGNQSPGQDYMVIGTGVSFQFSPEFNLVLGYQTQIFRNNLSAHFGSIRFGYRF